MRIEWLYKNSSDRVIVFFNGWGMDARAVAHLPSESDVLVISDYRDITSDFPRELTAYREIYVVAWSMGVWAAAHILPVWPVSPEACVALNGTEYPVDDRYGIPCKVYELTEKGMDERGREKFFCRMFGDTAEQKRFEKNRPQRELSEQCEELRCIRKQASGMKNTLKWDKVYLSAKDVIFPVMNQRNAWAGKAELRELEGGHYPFYAFNNWEEIIFGRHDR